MRNLMRESWVTLCVAIFCLGAGSSLAVGAEVRDTAGLFSAEAMRQADETIRNIQRDFRKDLLVETFAGVPENRKEEYARHREEFFASLVQERAKAARLDGIYVLVMQEPPPHRLRIQVGVGQATRQRAFLPADRDQLVRLLQSSFREGKYDEGLRTATVFVERTLHQNLSVPVGSTVRPTVPAAPASSPAGGSMLLLGLVIVGGVLAVIFLLRLLRGGMGGGRPVPGAGARMGGGGLFTGLLGGLGGALAGSWLYDRFFSGNAHASDSFNANRADAPPSDAGGDFTSSGGDVDSGFGGGGGDFGGGDFGGGGDA